MADPGSEKALLEKEGERKGWSLLRNAWGGCKIRKKLSKKLRKKNWKILQSFCQKHAAYTTAEDNYELYNYSQEMAKVIETNDENLLQTILSKENWEDHLVGFRLEKKFHAKINAYKLTIMTGQ